MRAPFCVFVFVAAVVIWDPAVAAAARCPQRTGERGDIVKTTMITSSSSPMPIPAQTSHVSKSGPLPSPSPSLSPALATHPASNTPPASNPTPQLSPLIPIPAISAPSDSTKSQVPDASLTQEELKLKLRRQVDYVPVLPKATQATDAAITAFVSPTGLAEVGQENEKWHLTTYWSCNTFALTTVCGYHEPVLPGGDEISGAAGSLGLGRRSFMWAVVGLVMGIFAMC